MANDPQTYALGYEGPEVQEILEKSEDIGPATQAKDGLMSAADKEKLDGVNTGAQANVIEQIEVGGVILVPASKKVTIPVDSAAAQGGANPVSSGALYAALLNYYTSAEVDQLIAGIKQFTYEVVAELPTASADTMYCIYFVPSTNPATQNVKDEYITVRSGVEGSYTYSWELVGSAAVDISGKADKVSGAVAGNLAGLDASGNLVDSGVPAEKIGEIEEEVSVLRNSAGIAEGIADTVSAGTPQEFVFRQSGGDGVNYMKRIKGKSLVWNQLFPYDISMWSGGAGSMSIEGQVVTISNGSNTYTEKVTRNNCIIAGHKYYTRATIVETIGETRISESDSSSFISSTNAGTYSSVKQANYTTTLKIVNAGGVGQGATLKDAIFVDLTLLFNGSVPENFTAADFEALYPAPYYPYNAGSVESNDAEAIETVGRNLWDEEWEVGSIDDVTGAPYASQYSIRSKNYIPVFPNTQYYIIKGSQYFYDANHNFISRRGSTGMFTTPSNCAYMRIVYGFSGAPQTTYNHDICINLSDPNFNGQYEPYWKRRIELGLKSIKVTDGTNIITVNGLKSAGSVYDEIDFVRKKYIKRVGSVDLGDLTWEYYSGTATFGVNGAITGFKTAINSQIICSKYTRKVIVDWSSLGDKEIGANAGLVRIKDSGAGTDATAFKTAMAGVPLYYELAKPIEYDLVDDIPNSILVDSYGTERAIFPTHEDGTPSAPFACDSNYSISVKNLVAFINAQNNG